MQKKSKIFFQVLFFVFIFSFSSAFAASLPTYQSKKTWPLISGHFYFKNIKGICSTSDGRIYVADTANHRIRVFTFDGRFLFEWGRRGNAPGELDVPYDIAWDGFSRLFVADSRNRRIQVFDTEGNLLEIFEDKTIIVPSGVTVDPFGNFYVSDNFNCTVRAFSPDGQLMWASGQEDQCGGRDEELNGPNGIAIGPDGNIYVADTLNNRVQILSPSGEYRHTLNKSGTLTRPKGVSIDSSGFAYVSDLNGIHKFFQGYNQYPEWTIAENFNSPFGISNDPKNSSFWIADEKGQSLFRFTEDGRLLNQFGLGNSSSIINTPTDISLDNNGVVIVADQGNQRIAWFDADGKFLFEIKSWEDDDGATSEFGRVTRLASDDLGQVFVCDTIRREVLAFSSSGEMILSLGASANEGDGLKQPWGIAIGKEGQFFVSEQGANQIRVFSPDGQNETILRGDGFSTPKGIAVGPDNSVYVADFDRDRIVRLNENDEILKVFRGEDYGFSSPNNVSVDSNENLFITDQDNHQILKISKDGELLDRIGEPGSFSGQIRVPEAAIPAPDGRLFVADSHNHRIQVFAPTQQTFNQKAIIVAGGGAYAGNDLWDATRLSAHQAYSALKNQGFSRNQVRYYSEDVGLDLDNNGLADDVLQPPSISLLEDSVTEWASDAEWLILYLVNHGNEGLFRMSSRETLSAAKLGRILDQRTGKTLVVIDACRAESFSSHLEGDNRIVIASAGTNQPAYFIGDGAVSFSSAFWSAVQGGKTVKASYSEGLAFLEEAGLFQTPAWNSGFDVQGEDLVLGYGARLGNKPLLEFPQVQIDPANRRLRLQVETHQESSADDISRVWALLRPNSLAPPEPDTPIIDLPTVELARQPDGTFSGETDLPINSTPFSVAFYARSINGQTAGPLVDHPVNDDFPRPSAILVQGYAPEPADRKAIARRIQFARETLLSRGFAEDDLHLFSPSDGLILDRLSDQLFTIANSDPGEVYLYLVGDGRMAEFPISAEETLTPDYLAGLAASLESLVLIWDAPYEDMNLLSPFSGPNRTIIAGFRRGPLAGAPAFSDLFWTDIGRGFSIGAAFRRASAFAWESNSPLLDDSDDGQFNTPDDGETAESQYLGSGVRLAAGLSGEPPIFLHGQAAFQLPVEDLALLDDETQYHAKIIPPDLFPGSPEPISRETVRMPFPADNGGLEIGRLTDFGTYRTALIATSSDGRTIELRRDNLFQNIGLDVFEPDNNRFEAKPITVDTGAFQERSIYPEKDIDWIVFGAKVDDPIFVRIKALEGEGVIDLKILMNQSVIKSFSFHLDSNGWAQKLEVPVTGKYHLQIEKKDGEGESPLGYGIRIDHQTAPFPGYLRGQIFDEVGNAISNAWIEIKGGRGEVGAAAVSSPSDGRFMIVHPPGTATLEVTAEGHNVYSASVEIPETGERSETIYLKKTAAVIPPPAPVPPTKEIIRGRLIDEEARPVGNAVILIESGLGSENVIEEFETTDAGRFRLELPAGRYQLTINAGGYKPRTEILQVIEGVQVLREITLSPLKPPFAFEPSPEGKPDSDDLLGFVFGQITDEEGSIIGDASITIQSATSEGKETRGVSSTEYGRFRIFHEPGEAILTVTADGYATKSLIVSIPAAGIKAVDVALVSVDSTDKTGGSGSAVDDTADSVPNQEDHLPNPSTEPISSAPPSLSPPTVPPENPVKDREEDSAPVPAPSIPRHPEPHAGEAGSGCFMSTIAG
jgi:sugar lactone lactonase YvrE